MTPEEWAEREQLQQRLRERLAEREAIERRMEEQKRKATEDA
jgi:hypothetical protein